MLRCLALRHSFGNSQANPQIKFHGVDPLSLLRSLQKGDRWPVFTPPAAGLFRRYRGRLLHRRSQESDRNRLRKALDVAQSRVSLPSETIEAAPTVSALRQQGLATYLKSEIKGGGIRRLEELIPRHPRDDAAWKTLSEIYRICHEQILSVDVPRLHLRMAAISLSWMRGDPLPAIIEKNREYNKSDAISAVIRNTLNDIEQEVRFKYFRLSTCYISVLAHCLKESGYTEYLSSLSSLPTYLEMGASDQTMISFIALGLSRHTAKELMEFTVEKEMDPAAALKWLRQENFDSRIASPIVRQDIVRVLESAGAA